MPFSATDLAAIDATEEVLIETSSDDGAIHQTIIWAVVADGEVYVRSYVGPDARWYREAVANPDVVLHVGERSMPCRAVHAGDARAQARTSAALERKYAGDPATASMVRPEVVPLTLRLDRR